MNIVLRLWLDFPHNAGEERFVIVSFFLLILSSVTHMCNVYCSGQKK